MTRDFGETQLIKFEVLDGKSDGFRHYDANEEIFGKTMKDQLRFSICYWHFLLAWK